MEVQNIAIPLGTEPPPPLPVPSPPVSLLGAPSKSPPAHQEEDYFGSLGMKPTYTGAKFVVKQPTTDKFSFDNLVKVR